MHTIKDQRIEACKENLLQAQSALYMDAIHVGSHPSGNYHPIVELEAGFLPITGPEPKETSPGCEK